MPRRLFYRQLQSSRSVVISSGRVLVQGRPITTAMGHLQQGTMCSYCGAVEAYYIPDGFCGPLCDVCEDYGFEHGFSQVYVIRIQRWISAKLWPISPRANARELTPAESVLHDPILSLRVSQYIVAVMDGSETWSIGDSDRSAPHGVEIDDTDP